MQDAGRITAPRKMRADMLVVKQGLAPSRARAQALIALGAVVKVGNEEVVDKAGDLLRTDQALRLRHQPIPYVSRGGLKLEAALDTFAIDVRGHRCLDVGASTGGFTDLLLQRGASEVVALDVGHNQLAYSLRQDARVQVLERCHVVHAPDDAIGAPVSRVVMDVSFISATRVLPALPRWLLPGAVLVTLVKPQFEVGPARVGNGGIVTCESARQDAIAAVETTARHLGLSVIGVCPSPVLGGRGNQEYLLACRWEGTRPPPMEAR